MPECVNEALLQEVVKRFTLFRCVASNLFFSFRIKYIYRLMSNIKISSHDQGFLFICPEFMQIGLEIFIPFIYSVFQSFQSVSWIWNISFNYYEILEFSCDYSTFTIMLTDPQVICNWDRFNFCKDSSSRISLFNSAKVPILLIFTRNLLMIAHFVHLFDIDLDFIETKNCRICLFYELLKITSFKYSIQSINIPMPDVDLVRLELLMLGRSLEFRLWLGW